MDLKKSGIELSEAEWGGAMHPMLKLDNECAFMMDWNGKRLYVEGEAGDEPSLLVACDSNPFTDEEDADGEA